MIHPISNYSLTRSTSCSCSTCCFGLAFQNQDLQDFIKTIRAQIKDIFPVAHASLENVHEPNPANKMCTPSVQLSSRTWLIQSVQVQLSSGPISMSEPKLKVASGSQEDRGHRRAEQETPREIPLTTEAVAARGDRLQHLRRRVAVSISRSACPASSSTAVGGSEEQDELRRRMDEYLLHEEC